MSSTLKGTVFGYVATNPEEGITQTKQKKMAKFSIALGGGKKDAQGNWPPTSAWLKVMVFEGRVDYVMKNITKGTRVLVTGNCEVSAYNRKTDGVAVASVTMMADSINILSKNDGQPARNDAPPPEGAASDQGGWG